MDAKALVTILGVNVSYIDEYKHVIDMNMRHYVAVNKQTHWKQVLISIFRFNNNKVWKIPPGVKIPLNFYICTQYDY